MARAITADKISSAVSRNRKNGAVSRKESGIKRRFFLKKKILHPILRPMKSKALMEISKFLGGG